jgi:peroxiredoxin
MAAPEIRGLDTRGGPMRLSDFRGKMVVLDFWGDW